jgi:nucleoside-diphosphate-sugar epimerase
MRWLVTGGSGFLGINLVRRILDRGDAATVIDIADFDYPDCCGRVRFVHGDIRNPDELARSFDGADIVVHCAAALPLYTPEDIHSTDVLGTRYVLEQALSRKVERCIYISSTSVYGVPDHHPIVEADALVGVGPYGQAKIDAEAECRAARERGLCTPILRPKSFVGPERLGAFALLYDWAATGHGFPLIGSGRNRYQLLDVDDLCDAIFACAAAPRATADSVFNIGAAEFGTMRDDFQAVLDRAGFGKRMKPLPAGPVKLALRALEVLRLSPLYRWIYDTAGQDSFVSIDRARTALGFAPKYSNAQALVRNFEWYLANRGTFAGKSGITHRVPWSQGLLGIAKLVF